MGLVSYQLLNAIPMKVEVLWYFGTIGTTCRGDESWL